eukprot:scaffold44984_cov77-Phaeocystis_antarctica.AAC.2
MATVCLSPHSPPFVRGGHLHAFDGRCAQHQHEERWCIEHSPVPSHTTQSQDKHARRRPSVQN